MERQLKKSSYESSNREKEKILVSHRKSDIDKFSTKKMSKIGLGDEPLQSINFSMEEIQEDLQKTELSQQEKTYKEKSKFLNNLRMIIILLGTYNYGYYIVITNVLGEVLTKEVYNIQDEKSQQRRIGDFGSLHSLGCFFSILLTGFFTNTFGRVKLIIVLELFSTICCFLHTIESMILLLVLRLVDGFLGGLIVSTATPFIREYLPTRLGPLGANLAYTFLVGFLLIASLMDYFFGGYDGLTKNWKFVISMPGFLGAFRFVMLIILFCGIESPAYHIDHFFNDKEVLRKKLLKEYKRIYVEEDAQKKTDDVIAEEKRILAKLGLKQRQKITFKMLFSPKYKNRFLFCVNLNNFQQLSGANFLTFFSTQLFNEISGNGPFMTLLLSVGNFISSFLAIIVTQMGLGRKKGLKTAVLTIVISHLMLIFSLFIKWNWLSAISLFVFIVAFGAGLGSILNVFVTEALPAYGVGVAFSCQFLVSSIVAKAAPYAMSIIGVEGVLTFFAVACMFYFCYIEARCKETKGLTEEEITELYMSNKNK